MIKLYFIPITLLYILFNVNQLVNAQAPGLVNEPMAANEATGGFSRF